MKQVNYGASKAQQGDYCSGAPLVRPDTRDMKRVELAEPKYSGAQGGEEPSGVKRRYARNERSMKRAERL